MTLLDKIFPAPIYPATPAGRPVAKISPDIEIRDRDTLAAWYRRGTRRFIFPPESAGLVGIDCDRKNGKDGIAELAGITELPTGFYVSTPSGGRHYYFWSDGRDYVSAEIRPGLEIKHRAFITLAGSISDRGRYVAYGDAATIQELPAALRVIMPTRSTAPAPQPRRSGESLALHRILDILRGQGLAPVQGQRNYFAFQFSRYARKQGHRAAEVLAFLAPLSSGDFSQFEIRAAVRSAYQGSK